MVKSLGKFGNFTLLLSLDSTLPFSFSDKALSLSLMTNFCFEFDDQVYDLDVDGHYLASSHKTKFNHEVHISVYNHYMREIQVTNKETGEVMLSINNMGDVVNKAYPYFFKSELKKCEYEDECEFFFKEYVFDAQEFEYVVQIHPHSYEDQALKEGETGLHIDVYPHPYPGYKFEDYDGLYFSNPLVEVCESN